MNAALRKSLKMKQEPGWRRDGTVREFITGTSKEAQGTGRQVVFSLSLTVVRFRARLFAISHPREARPVP